MKKSLLFLILYTSIIFSEEFYSEDFSENSFPPAGWETSGTPLDSNRWEIDNASNSYNTTPPALAYHWSPSTPGNYEPYSHDMLSPSIDVSGNTSVLVFFDIALDFWGASNFTNGMTVSYNGGGDWVEILNYEISPGAGFVEINRRTESFIAEVLSGSNLQIKFTAYGTNSYYIDDWFIDNIEVVSAPKLNIVSISSSNNNSQTGIIGDEVSIEITSNSDLNNDPVVQINGNISNVSYGGGNRWTATYIVQNSDPDGPVEFAIDFTDANNIDGVTVRETTDNTNVIIDNSDPPSFTVGTATSEGGNEYNNIWNETNLSINLEANVPQDSAVSSYNYIDGNSLMFDGINDEVFIPSIVEYQFTNQLTIEAWIKPLSAPENYTGFLNRSIDSGPLEGGIGFVYASTGWHFFIKTDLPNTIDYTTMPVASAPVNQWTHIAATYNGSKVVLFRNGTALDSSVVYGDVEWSGVPDEIDLGSFTKDGTTKYFNGNIDDVRIWNTVRTRQEIKVYRKVELIGNESGLVGYWKIDSGTGSIINDLSSNSNNGTINGASWEIQNSPLQFKTPVYDTGVIIGSTFQLLGRVGSNSFEEFGVRDTITQQDFNNGIKYINSLKSNFEGITNFSHGETVQLRAYLYDDAGNYSVGEISSTNMLIDIVANAPNPVSISSNNQFQNLAKTGNVINLSMSFNEDVSSPNILIDGYNSDSVQDLGDENFQASYTLTGGETNGLLTSTISVTDYYGNQNEYSGSTDGSRVRFDSILPIANIVTLTSGNPWNQSWAKVGDSIQFFIETSEQLLNISGLVNGNSSSSIGISLDQYNIKYIFSDSDIDGLISFEIVLTDSAGNESETIINTTNNSQITFDKTNPSTFTVGEINTNGGNIVSEVWNSTNTSLNINIPIDDDNSLDSGRVQLQAKIGSNNFENLGNYSFILSNEINSSKTISISDDLVESISGYSENDTIIISALIFDIPGNMSSGNQSLIKLVINESLPLVLSSNIESDFSDSSLAAVGSLIKLSFSTDTEIQIPTVLISDEIATVSNTGGNNWESTYIMTGTEPDGVITFRVDLEDINGNPNSISDNTTNGTSVVFDNSKPSLSYVNIKSSNQDSTLARIGDTITIKFKGDELLTSQSATILLNSGNIFSDNNESDIIYYAKYILQGDDPEGDVNFEIIVTDSVGIQSNPVIETTNGSSVTFDRTLPVISNLHIESNNNNDTSIGILGDEIFLTFSSSELLQIDSILVYIAGQSVSTINSEGNFTSSYILNGDEPSGNISYTLDYQDLAGNHGVQLDSTQDSSYVKHDLIPPEIINCYISSNNPDSSWAKEGDSVFVTFVSSEPLSNIEVSIENTLTSIIQVNSTKYIAYLIMDNSHEQGQIPFLISYTDLGGIPGDNINNTTNASIVKYDNQSPTINNILTKTNNTYGDSLAGIGTIDTLKFSVSEPYRTLKVVFDDKINIPNEENLNFYSTNTFEEVDTSYWVSFSLSMTDSAGNSSDTINQEDTDNIVWFDGKRPELDTVQIYSNNVNNSTVCIIGDSIYLKYSASENIRFSSSLIANSTPDRTFQLDGFYNSVYCISGIEDEGVIPFSIFNYEDFVGNQGLEVNTSSSNENVVFDMTDPNDFRLGDIFSREGNEKEGYWNSTNRSLDISIPIDNDLTLEDGYVQIQVKLNEVFNDLGSQIIINESNLGRDTLVSYEQDLFLNQDEFSNDREATFRALISDKSGNSTISQISNSTIYIDTLSVSLINIHIESNNIDTTRAKVGDSLKITFTTSESLDSISIEVFENSCINQSEDNNWISFYEFQDSDEEGNTTFNIFAEDLAGNISSNNSETSDSSFVLFDKTKPNLNSVSFYSSNETNQELAIVGDTLFLDIESNEPLLDINIYISEEGDVYNPADTIINDISNDNFYKSWRILNGNEEEGYINFKINGTDLSGNIGDTISITTDGSSILYDRTPPIDFIIENLLTNNGNQVEGYWNSTNENLIFSIPIPDDNTLLDGGGIQIQASFLDSNYLDLGEIYYIQEDALSDIKTMIIHKEYFQNLEGFDDDINVNFRAKMWDKAGNFTYSSENNDQLHIDIIDPTIEPVNIYSNNILDTNWAKAFDSLFIDFSSSETLLNSRVLINNSLLNIVNTSDLNWEFSNIISDDFMEGQVNFKIYYEDIAGNIGDTISQTSNGSFVSIDNSEPIISTLFEGSDSIDLDHYNDSSSIYLFWEQVDSLSGIKDVFITYSSDTLNIDELIWEQSQSEFSYYSIENLSLQNNETYYGAVYARDYAGNLSDIKWGDGFMIDTEAPDTGKIEDGKWFLEMDYTPDSTFLSYNWKDFNDNIGIRNYEIAIGTNNSKTNILDWHKTDSLETFTVRNLLLDRDTCYYTYLRAYDSALNISKIVKTDGIYFDDSEPKVIKLSPDINDSLGFLSVLKNDTIKIKFNRNIFFYDLKVKSSIDSNFIFNQSYSDSILTIYWDDTLLSYDTLTVFLDSALAYNTLFVSETLSFYSRLWGDLNHDYDITVQDIYAFNNQWPDIDLGPVLGVPPNVSPILDNEIDLIDMSVFSKMWRWKYFNLSYDSIDYAAKNSYHLDVDVRGDKLLVNIPENINMAEFLIGNTSLDISNFSISNIKPSTSFFDALDSIKGLKQFSLADKNGLDSVLMINIPKDEEIFDAKIQYLFLNKFGDTLSYGQEEYLLEILPDHFKVYSNYPNPFNPNTNIRIDLAKQNNVEIIIFDILGREIFNKKLNNLRAGRHQFIWEGVNNIGNQVSSGVYIIQTKSGVNSHIQKALLLK